MSDVTPASTIGTETILLLPSQVITDPRFNVRPFSTDSNTGEDMLIEKLAQSIEEIGQLDAVLITPANILIAGHRRRRAVLLANERRTARGQSLLRLRCAMDRSPGDLRQKAIRSNLQRKESSAMDLAYLIVQIRKEYGWGDYKGAQRVAEYLGVNAATVTEHEHLLRAEKELQNQVHAGRISAHSALKLLKKLDTPEERADALTRAAEIQAEDRLDAAMEAHLKGRASGTKTPQRYTENAIANSIKTRIEHPAIIKAIRERHTVVTTHRKLSLTRAELIASISQFDTDFYPDPLRDLARYWSQTFAAGMGNPDELKARVLALTQVPEPSRKPTQRSEALAS